MRNLGFSVLALTGILTFSGCTTSSAANDSQALTSSSAPEVSSPTNQPPNAGPSTEPAEPENQIAEQSIENLRKLGIELDKTVKVKGGSYPQYKILMDSPLATFDPAKQDGKTPKGWSQKDLDESQHFAANIMLNFVLDNPILNDYRANQDILISHLKEVIKPTYLSDYIASVEDRSAPFVTDTFTENFTGDTSRGFRYVTDGQTPRIADLLDLEVTTSQELKGDQYYEFEGAVLMNVVDKNSDPFTMVRGITYGVTTSIVDGELKLSGTSFKDGNYTAPLAVEN